MTSVAPMITVTGRSDSCSDNCLSVVAATIHCDSRLLYTLQATGWRDDRSDSCSDNRPMYTAYKTPKEDMVSECSQQTSQKYVGTINFL